jgi:septum formation protein
VSVPPAPPLLLASTSPQRRAILTQLGVPFEVEAPRYVEDDAAGVPPVELVRAHAQGKARSLAGEAAGDRPVLGVDTTVVLDGRMYSKPESATDAVAMLDALAGRTHEVVSGLCLVAHGWEELHHEVTRVTFRPLDARDLAAYEATHEWAGRAGAYAIQGRGAALVERIEGDYLNVVGLPAALLVRLLSQRFPGLYGFG